MNTFDADVREGDVRIFADSREPLVALVLDEAGCRGWRLVPVSPLPLPGDAADLVLGTRVLQLWNALLASRAFVARSWLVDRVTAEDLAGVRREAAAVQGLPERLSAYQLKHLVTLPRPQPELCAVPRASPAWRRPAWLTAASIALIVGTAWYLGRETAPARESVRIMTLGMRAEPRVEALAEADEPVPETDAEETLAPVEVARPTLPLPDIRSVGAVSVTPPVAAPRMVSVPQVKGKALPADAVVTSDAGRDAPRLRATLRWLKARQEKDGSWGPGKLRDTALAVIAFAAQGETGAGGEFGETFARGVRYLTETPVRKVGCETGGPLVCALCCGYAATRNPNVKTAAEAWLEHLGDPRSVEIGRDWSGLLADLSATTCARGSSASAGRVAAPRPEDEIAAACVFVLDVLKKRPPVSRDAGRKPREKR